MKNSSKQIDRKVLKTLEPLNRLNPILLDELAAKSIIDEIPAGRIICRHGEKDSRQIYLLSGQIEVAAPGETKTTVIKSKSALKTPIAEGSPRTVTLKAKTASTLLYIDADLLELLMSDEPQLGSTYEVTEITADDSDDWMLTFLQSPAFLQLPTENIQKLLTHMEEIPAKKNQIVIKQGDKDDNYYIIKSGTCNVHRKPYENSASVLLAVLPTGSGFGEEALISNGSRNATITMREDGSLMRLKKKDFLTLLIKPLITYYEDSETKKKLNEGGLVIDVRSEQQAKESPVEGAVNIPLSMLRMKFDSLNAEREYLLVCNDGSQSAAAAFLMIQGGLLKCSVLKGGLSNSASTNKTTKPAAKPITQQNSISAKAEEQAVLAKKQTEQLAAQQEQIKAAREKAEQDIIKHKKELAESRARIAKKNQQLSSAKKEEAAQLKVKASQELAKAQTETKAIELRQKETTENILRAEEMMKQSEAAAEQMRKQAEKDAALIKQRAVEEVEQAREQAEAAAAFAKQRAIEEAKQLRAEEMMKQAEQAREQAEKASEIIKQRAIEEAEQLRVEKASQDLAKAQAEKEAALIKQRAIEEAECLRAEVEAARQKMEQDAARLKEEEEIIKKSALKVKHEADEIRREALNDAKQVRSEIEETRALLNQKLQQTQEEEKRKHDAILAEAKEQADKLSAIKTQQADAEAEAIRQKAKEDALRLHNELEETRKQIEAEAARAISELKEQSKKAIIAEQEVKIIEDEVLIELVTEENVDYKAVSIPGISTINPINDEEAQQKAEAIKAKLAQSQEYKIAQQSSNNIKVHKSNDRTILEGNEDLFIFKEPEIAAKAAAPEQTEQPAISQRTRAESALTQISIEPTKAEQKSVVIFPQQEQETANRNNIFLNQEQEEPQHTTTSYNIPQFDKQAYMRKNKSSKSNTLAIAASFLMILAGAIFTLHATNTLKVQSIAALFNSGNDTVQTTAIVKTKTIRKKVLRADTKVNIKKKVGNKMDDIMQGWQDVLSEAKNPKKL
ncbi:MAG: cyclic nucleotide-binding domain-containing protein [Gammaproteobacteria bacterium]|nr:cyclic nucleotide-binding domain-containing protein [Gammaproteobacteria bacterium]